MHFIFRKDRAPLSEALRKPCPPCERSNFDKFLKSYNKNEYFCRIFDKKVLK